jgi:hypothetical protein
VGHRVRTPIQDEITDKLRAAVEAKNATPRQSFLTSTAPVPAADELAPTPPDVKSSSARGPPAAPRPRMFFDEKALAERWGLSHYSVYQMRRAGTGPKFLVVGKNAIRYAVTDVEAFEASESFHSMGELYAARSNRARARAAHRKALVKARAVLAEGKSA